MSNQPKVGKQKSKKRQPCKTGKDEEEKTSCKKQPPVLNSSVPEDPGHGAFKDDRLSHQDEMVKNMAQNAVKEKVSSNIQSNDKKLGNTELQCLSKSKNNPNLCANIPFKESNQVNQGKRDCIIPVEDNEENKSLNVKTKGKASTLEDLSASPSCTSSGKPTKANDKEMTSTNIVNDEQISQKSKAELRAQRRALQEAQRAAKQARKSGNQESSQSLQTHNKSNEQLSTPQARTGVNVAKDSDCINVNNEMSVCENDSKISGHLVTNQLKTQGDGVPEKSKAEIRAQRRALQEAQRAAKQAKKDDKGGAGVRKSESHSKENKHPIEDKGVKAPIIKQNLKIPSTKQVKLFEHLTPYRGSISIIGAAKEGIHSSIIQLGLQYASGIVCGSNARCIALIEALIEVVKDFIIPDGKDFSHALNFMHIEPSMKFLETCRPASLGMQVVCKKLMEYVASLSKDLNEREAKLKVEEFLRKFLKEDIMIAHDAIVQLAKQKITENDVILTYSCSYLVKKVLSTAHKTAKFRVIIVDARPKLEGRSMFHYLTQQGIECTYVLINAVAHVMQEATKVFLGAHAVLANGYVMSRVGSSQVALVAKAFNKPVLVCCETYKFSELVQTDSFVLNELGNPDELVDIHRDGNPLSVWHDLKHLNILNLYYDVTPPDLVTVIINDTHLMPCTSVPVLLRVKPTKR